MIFSVDKMDNRDYIKDVMTCIDNLRKGKMMIDDSSSNIPTDISHSSLPKFVVDFAKDNKITISLLSCLIILVIVLILKDERITSMYKRNSGRSSGKSSTNTKSKS